MPACKALTAAGCVLCVHLELVRSLASFRSVSLMGFCVVKQNEFKRCDFKIWECLQAHG